MPGPILHLGATRAVRPRRPGARPRSPFPRVLVGGQPRDHLEQRRTWWPAARSRRCLDGPCVTAQWVVGATRVLAGGIPVVIQGGKAICVPTGTPLLPIVVQPRVVAT